MKMREITTILWDIDGTLLDFKASETVCIRKCLAEYGVEISRQQMEWYSECNHSYWKRFERREISKDRVYLGRFEDFFQYLGKEHVDPVQFNEAYQQALGNSVVMQEGALEICASLKGRYRQYVVTNGSSTAQKGKLKRSGLGQMMDGVFISEEMETEKPSRKFFDLCSREIPDYDPEKTMIIGDSLTSDIAGGNNAGILCCWFNPAGLKAPDNLRIDYEIRSLYELNEILGKAN